MKFGSRMYGNFYLWKDDITFVLFHSTAPTGGDQGLSSINAKSTELRIGKDLEDDKDLVCYVFEVMKRRASKKDVVPLLSGPNGL